MKDIDLEKIKETVGYKIKTTRDKKHISIDDMAIATSIAKGTISGIENGKNFAGIDKIILICTYLNISPNWLLLNIEDGTALTEDELGIIKSYQDLTNEQKYALKDKIKDFIKENERKNIEYELMENLSS